MTSEQIIKKQARDALKGNYIKAITALMVLVIAFAIVEGLLGVLWYVIYLIDENIASGTIVSIGYNVLDAVALFLFSPLYNGFVRAYYNNACTGRFDLSDVIYYMRGGKYSYALRLNFSMALRLLLPTFLIFIPYFAYEAISDYALHDSFYGTTIYLDFSFILQVICTLCLVLYSLKYFTVYTICVDNEQLTPKQAVEYSKYIMKQKHGSAARLIFSFTPWLLLCLLVLPMIYVIPYMTQALCTSAKWLTKATFEVN